jgi:hypothetical protein
MAQEGQWWYDHEIIVDPADSNVIFLGGIHLRRFDGSEWSLFTNGLHEDQHTMAWAGSRLIVGNDGGVWSSEDSGSSWTNHNSNLVITQFYDGSLHPADPHFALGGSQDNGTQTWSGDPAWRRIFPGDGADNAISFVRPGERWLVSFQGLEIVRVGEGGRQFLDADDGIEKTGASFIGRVEKSPVIDNLVLAATDNLWKSPDFFDAARPSWAANSPDLRSPQGEPVSITAIAFAESDVTGSIYGFGAADGTLSITPNGGSSWINLDSNNSVPDRYVTDLAFDPRDPNTLYVTLSGFDEGTPGRPGHVFKTRNALSSLPVWENISPPVNIPHNTIVVDHVDTGNVYVGTDLGLFSSSNAGVDWVRHGPDSGLPNVAVFDLQISNTTGRLVAFTHGRGAFANSTISKIDSAPVIESAILSRNGQIVESSDAGQSGLRVTVNGRGFTPTTEVSVNNVPVITRIPADPGLASTQRAVDLDENVLARGTAGPLNLRAKNLAPVSGLSNVVTAGRLTGLEIVSIKVKPKATGFLLKIVGFGFQPGAAVEVNDLAGRSVPVKSTAFIGGDSLKVKVTQGAPPPGTPIQVRAINSTGIRSNLFVTVSR